VGLVELSTKPKALEALFLCRWGRAVAFCFLAQVFQLTREQETEQGDAFMDFIQHECDAKDKEQAKRLFRITFCSQKKQSHFKNGIFSMLSFILVH